MFMFEDFDNEQEVIDYAKGLFNNPAEIAGLLNKCKLSYSVRIWDNSLIACGLDLIQAAIAKMQQKDCPVEVYNYYKKKECIGKKMFTDYLSVENEQQAQDRLIGSSLLNQDFFWTFLNLVYFALVLLDDNLGFVFVLH